MCCPAVMGQAKRSFIIAGFCHLVVWPGILAAGSSMVEGLQIADVAVKTAASNCRCMCEVQHPNSLMLSISHACGGVSLAK